MSVLMLQDTEGVFSIAEEVSSLDVRRTPSTLALEVVRPNLLSLEKPDTKPTVLY